MAKMTYPYIASYQTHTKRHNNQHTGILATLQQQASSYDATLVHTQAALSLRQVWQRALELSVQQPLLRKLQQSCTQSAATLRPVLQAAFS